MRTTTVDDPSAVHACAVPGSDEQLWEMTARFLGIGLAAGEQVVYLSDGTADAVLERLVDDRVPVDRPLADGQLTIVDPESTRASMRVPVRDAAGALAAMVDGAVDAGYTGLRVTGQLSSGAHRSAGPSLADYDGIIDTVLAGRPGRVLCFYDRHRFTDGVIERMRALHRVEIEATALYDDGLLRVTRLAPFRMRLAGEVDHSNRPVIARMVATTLDDALRSDSAPAALELDLSSLRFLDVAGAVGLVHAAEEFPEVHRLVLTGVRPAAWALDRCGAPFAAQLDVSAHPGVSQGFRCPGATGTRGARIPSKAPGHGRDRGSRPPARPGPSGCATRSRTPARRTTSSPAPHRSSPPPAAATSRSRWRCAPRPRARSPTCRRQSGLPGPTGGGDSATVVLALSVGPDHSGQTLATRWARDLRALTRGRGGVTVIVEHDPDLDGLDGGFWTELDAALNVALADVARRCSASIPELPLHLEVADGARRNHPLVLVDGALRHNPEHRAHGRC